jgi:hypothetical protein
MFIYYNTRQTKSSNLLHQKSTLPVVIFLHFSEALEFSGIVVEFRGARHGNENNPKAFLILTDTFIGTFRQSLLRANHPKRWGAKLPAYFAICGKGSGVARVSWRGKPVSLTGDGFLLLESPI